MSSTNRGGVREASDYYVTPQAEVHKFLRAFRSLEPRALNSSGYVLDPCAGGDHEHPMTYPTVLSETMPEITILTLDIREDSLAETKADYLLWTPSTRPQVIITNPPFALAEQIIRKAVRDIAEGGWVIMLLRLNFFGSQKRQALWREMMPKWVFVHPERMSFTDNGRTDSIEYMHACWQRGHNQDYARLVVLA